MKTCRLGKLVGLLAVALTFLVPLAAMADSLSPSTYSRTMNVGETINLTKTFTVTKTPPTSVPVDIMFMTDSTGSMGSLIGAVKTGAADIMNATKSLGDVSFAVAQYRDVGDTFVYKLDQNFTNTTSAVQTAINGWTASGGGDAPEANLYALYKAADAAWRPGATHILLWFGDNPGHEPSQDGVTVASAISKLQSKNIKVMALNATTSTSSNLDTYTTDTKLSGQATKVTSATGGSYFDKVDATNAVQKIKDSITLAFTRYSKVDLDFAELPTGWTVTATPVSAIGSYDRSVDRDFTFNLAITATTAGTYNFNLYGRVDGGRTATENDSFVVNPLITKIPLEMVLAVDVSGSIDASEYKLQKDGYVNAFKDPSVIDKILKVGPVAAAYTEWSGASENKTVVDWTLISDAASAATFADKIAAAARSFSGQTAPGSALKYATELFAKNSYDGARKVIDISGDGIKNDGLDGVAQRDAALKAGITTINALAIDAPTGDTGTYDYYVKNIIGGKDPFAFKVKDFTDFQKAVYVKIGQELYPEYAKFDFIYYYSGKMIGEYYKGYVYAPAAYYKNGDKINVAKDENGDPGYYLITSKSAPSATYKPLMGQVFVQDYYDLESKMHFNKATGAYALVNLGKAVGTGYLGSEYSYIVNTSSSLYRFGNYSAKFWEADVPINSGKFGFRFDYGNGDWYTGYFYGKYTDYNVGWTKETSAGLYRILTKAYSAVATSYYGKVYLDKYWDTHSRTYYSGASLISMFGSYYGASYLGSESGWLIKAYTYPKYRFFGFGYYEADGVGPQV